MASCYWTLLLLCNMHSNRFESVLVKSISGSIQFFREQCTILCKLVFDWLFSIRMKQCLLLLLLFLHPSEGESDAV